MTRSRDDIRMVNCCSCGRDMLGESELEWAATLTEAHRKKLPQGTAGRVKGRPWCADCLEPREPTGVTPLWQDDGNPAIDNAVRAMEGA
jgi:hypothetical protein